MARGRRHQTAPPPPPRAAAADEDSDEEISEDEAFNSADENRYGDAIARIQGGDSGPSESEGEEDGEEDGEHGMLLSDLLSGGGGAAAEPEEVTALPAGLQSDDEEEDEEGDEQTGLRDMVDAMAGRSRRRRQLATAVGPESEFGSGSGGGGLTMEALLGAAGADADAGALRKRLKGVDKGADAAPLAPVKQRRLEREVAYDATRQDVTKFQATVKAAREARTRDFTEELAPRQNLSVAALTDKFQPTTDLEKAVRGALDAAGLSGREGGKTHDDGFASSSDDEGGDPKEASGAAARLRARMQYAQEKSKRTRKIKSKLFHKIRKKQAERRQESELQLLRETDPEAYRALQEEDAEKRIRERMTLSHKNSGKWARQQLKRGRHMDTATRQAISEQAQLGQELRRKMDGMESDSDGGGSDGYVSGEDLAGQARDVVESLDGGGAEPEPQGIFKLKFMQRAQERERERARKEAAALLEELEAGSSSDSSDDSDEGEGEAEAEAEQPEPDRKPAKADVDAVAKALPGGAQRLVALTRGKRARVTGNVTVDLETDEAPAQPEQPAKGPEENPWIGEHQQKRRRREQQATGKKAAAPQLDVQGSVERAAAALRESETAGAAALSSAAANEAAQAQAEVVRAAFAAPDEAAEFAKEKGADVDREVPAVPDFVSGWGSWAGAGAPQPKKELRKHTQAVRRRDRQVAERAGERKDAALAHVIINEKVMKKAKKYAVGAVPYPFTSRAQYERSLQTPIGDTWNTRRTVQAALKPDVITRAGTVINPLKLTKKAKREFRDGAAAAVAASEEEKRKKRKKKGPPRRAVGS